MDQKNRYHRRLTPWTSGGEKPYNGIMRLFVAIALVLAMVAIPTRIMADPTESSAGVGAVYSGTNNGDCPNGPGFSPPPATKGPEKVKIQDTYCPGPPAGDFWGHGTFAACHMYCTSHPGSCPTTSE